MSKDEIARVVPLFKQAKKVIVMNGAGIATAAGLPDFRSPKTGLYANLEKYNLPSPQAIFELSYFVKNPQPFFTLAAALYPGNFSPTYAHAFCVLLQQKEALLRVFTQNIDTLEERAGVRREKLVEAHGSFATAHCLNCKAKHSAEDIKAQVLNGEIVRCQKKRCASHPRGLIKPDIVFFGEGLPPEFFERMADFKSCDLLIVMGTSLAVQPFASLIDMVSDDCPRILINMEKVGEMDDYEPSSMFVKYREDGFDFEGRMRGGPQHTRDFALITKCDEAVLEIARGLGWSQELEDIYRDCQLPATDEPGFAHDNTVHPDQTESDHHDSAAAEDRLDELAQTLNLLDKLDLETPKNAVKANEEGTNSTASVSANL